MVTFSLTWQYINTSLSSSIRNHKRTHYLLFSLHIMGHSLGKPKLLTAEFKLMPRLFRHLPFVFSASLAHALVLQGHSEGEISVFLLMRWQPLRSWWGSSSLQLGFNLKPLFKPESFDRSPGLNSSNLGGSPTIELLVMRVSVWVGSSKIRHGVLQTCPFLSFLWIWSYFFHSLSDS